MRNALVTGPSSGIGRAVSLELANRGFHVIAAGRSETRVGAVVDEIGAGGGSAEYLHLDLASLDSARGAAQAFEASERTLDVLINNAGVGVIKGVTVDGFQIQFGVNHLGHFMLYWHLRRTFRPGSRIIQVSSEVHRRAKGIDFAKVTRPSRAPAVSAYAVSKLANILFARELARLHPEWRVHAVHPGMVDTGIWPAYSRPLTRGKLLTVDEGADTIVWCATDDGLSSESGLYYARRRAIEPSAPALDDDLARELWARSERWCGLAPVE